MTRRGGKLAGVQYCGNSANKEVHDLDNEKAGCQIDEIIEAGHEVPFRTLAAAHEAGYDNCKHCLGSSKR